MTVSPKFILEKYYLSRRKEGNKMLVLYLSKTKRWKEIHMYVYLCVIF